MAQPGTALTVRPSASAILTIDSEDRFDSYEQSQIEILATQSNNTPYNFTVSNGRAIMTGMMSRIGVSEINYPWIHPNINNKTNQIAFSLSGPGGITFYTITIPVAFYRPVDLAAALQGAIRLLDPALINFTFTYGVGNNPNFLHAINNAGFSYSFLPMPYNTSTYPYPNSTRQLIDLLGFSWAGPSYPLPTYITSGGGGYSLAQGSRYVDIVSNILSGKQGLGDGSSQKIAHDSICRVYIGESTNNTVSPSDPLFTPPGCVPFVIHRLYPVPKMMNWDARTNIGSSLSFKVYDDEGDLINTSTSDGIKQQTINWSMTLLASEN